MIIPHSVDVLTNVRIGNENYRMAVSTGLFNREDWVTLPGNRHISAVSIESADMWRLVEVGKADLNMTSRRNLTDHIAGVQARLTERNKRIAELEAQIKDLKSRKDDEEAIKEAYGRGYRQAVRDATHLSATSYNKITALRPED